MQINEFIHEVFGTVRAFIEEGTVWFLLSDIVSALKTDHVNAVRVDNEDKRLCGVKTPGGVQKQVFVDEAAMYELVLTSRCPKACEFKKWVTHTVLPSIRKTGGYIEGQENLSAADRAVLDERVKTLSAEVRKACEGKRKLQDMLLAEEERCSQAFGWYRDASAQLRDVQHKLDELTDMLSDVDCVERYLLTLRRKQELDRAAAEAKRREEAFSHLYVQVEVEHDPLVTDWDGNIVRLSELLGKDRRR